MPPSAEPWTARPFAGDIAVRPAPEGVTRLPVAVRASTASHGVRPTRAYLADVSRDSPLRAASEGRTFRRRGTGGPGVALGWLLTVGLGAVFFWQLGQPGLAADVWGVSGRAVLEEGRWWTLFTSMVVHGGVAHILFNTSAMLSLYAQLGADYENRPGAWLKLLLLFVVSGLAGSLAYVALNPQSVVPAVGASGAICGVWGAAARSDGSGRTGPLLDRRVFAHTINFAVMNLVLVGLVLLARQASGGLMQGGVAWEAHVGGYLVGILLAPVFRPKNRPSGPWDD